MLLRQVQSALITAVVVLLTAFPAAADSKSGTIQITSQTIAAGIGVSWGDGEMTLLDGSTHTFSMNGFSVVDVGISSVSASGEVYNLRRLEDFNGTYTAGQVGAAVGVGGSTARMKNENGVVITLSSSQQGIRFTVAPEGVKIRLK